MANIRQQSGGGNISSSWSSSKVVYFFVAAIVVPFAAALSHMVMGGNKQLSMQQRNQYLIVFLAVGLSASVGLASYIFIDKKRQSKTNDRDENDPSTNAARPKDIWKVGESSQTSLKKPKAAYTGKAFGSKYYYAHNDSKTTGGYKDGLKMEDYRMNGPRLLSVNGQAVDDSAEKSDNNDGHDEHGVVESSSAVKDNNATLTKITANEPNVKKITKYFWDDPGNGKGIATIRVDVLPGERFGEFVNFRDVDIKNVTATLPGEGLLANVFLSGKEVPSYQLKIDKLYGDAADVKVIVKPKRFLIKVHKKKHGFLSGNDDNLKAWPQPHRKI